MGYSPFRSTNPSTTGVTLAIDWPTSTTNAVPLPAANLKAERMKLRNEVTQWHPRVQNASVGDIEGWNAEFLKHDFSHPFTVCRCVPSRLGDKDRMVRGIATHNMRDSMVNQRLYRTEVAD